MEQTVACINNDLVLPIGRMRDVMITGYGQSNLDDMLKGAGLTAHCLRNSIFDIRNSKQ
ncbi:MAG: hypothetical protein ACQERS_07505 [Bacteroidota bacterium]